MNTVSLKTKEGSSEIEQLYGKEINKNCSVALCFNLKKMLPITFRFKWLQRQQPIKKSRTDLTKYIKKNPIFHPVQNQ